MVVLNVKGLYKLIGKILILALSPVLIYFILWGIGIMVNKYIPHIFTPVIYISKNPYLATPGLGAAAVLMLFVLIIVISAVYIITMIILSAIIKFLLKKNIIVFVDDTKKIGIFEKFIKTCLNFPY